MSVLVAFSVTPLGVGEGVGEIVAEAVRVVRDSGLPNSTDSMFTVIEGETWEEVMLVVQRAVEAVAARAPRVSTVIKADWRKGATDAMAQKVAAFTGLSGDGAAETTVGEATQDVAYFIVNFTDGQQLKLIPVTVGGHRYIAWLAPLSMTVQYVVEELRDAGIERFRQEHRL